MKVAFRTDASTQIGTGHFMRCLTLADKLKNDGSYIRFLSRNLPAHLIDMLAQKGMEYVRLSEDDVDSLVDELAHSSWLGISQSKDAEETIDALSDHFWDWIVVDHYALDLRWESIVRSSVKKIMVIDDLADRNHDCDILLDQNYYDDFQTRYHGKVAADCRMFLGPRYALLREEFRTLREKVKVRSGEPKKVLVFFGGIDADNFTSEAIKALSGMNIKIKVDVVIGAQHPSRELIEKMCAKYGYTCHVQTIRMAELMSKADVAIGAGGTVIWERCCLGLPAISLCIAENQRKQISDAAMVGVLLAPAIKEDVASSILLHAKSLLQNPGLIKLISNSAIKLVDGKGAFRIANAMECASIEMKVASKDDAKSLFKWRNHLSIRKVSKNSRPILWEDHKKWFDAVLADENRHLLIGFIDKIQFGVVRFDIKNDMAEVSIYLVPKSESKGQGKNLLLASESWLRKNHPEIKKINAIVLNENEASKKLFSSSNYSVSMISYQKDL